jgi:type IV pilus assembly protein PilE
VAGFSLIELMVTVAIAAILAAIAYPSYTQYVMRSRRSDAKAALLDLAARQERIFSIQNQYTNDPTTLGYPTAFPVNVLSSGQAYYRLRVTLGAQPTSYTAFADPIGPQAADAACGTYSITNLGVQSVTGTQSAASCW